MPTGDGAVSRRLALYRNGDPGFRPVIFHYSSRKFRTWEKIEEEIERLVPPRNARWGYGGTGAKVLWTIDGSSKIVDVPGLHDSNATSLVIGGPEDFQKIPGGYQSIPTRTPEGKEDPRKESGNFYREKNKNLYGDRPDNQKIYNKSVSAQVKKMHIYKNGDDQFRAKMYVFRKKQTPTWKTFLDDITRLAPPDTGGKCDTLYSEDGEEVIESFDEIENDHYYVAAQGAYVEVLNGYDKIGKGKRGKKSSRTVDEGVQDDAAWEDEELRRRDEEILREHKMKNRGERREKDKIFNRADQIKTVNYQIYAFVNGEGMDSFPFNFTEPQILRGIPWICEQIAKKFRVSGKKLLYMNGKPVKKAKNIVNKGCYILLPHGQAFRDTWYYLPEGAVDTGQGERSGSADSRTESGRGDSRGRSVSDYDDRSARKGRSNRRRSVSPDDSYRGRKKSPERRRTNNDRRRREADLDSYHRSVSETGTYDDPQRNRRNGRSYDDRRSDRSDDERSEPSYGNRRTVRRTDRSYEDRRSEQSYDSRILERSKDGRFRKDSARRETRGAKKVKDSKETRVDRDEPRKSRRAYSEDSRSYNGRRRGK